MSILLISSYRSYVAFLLRNIFVFLLILSFNETTFAKLSHRKWQKLETPHFDILFDAEQKDMALEYAVEAEMIHEILQPYFSERPSKTIIILNDDTDNIDAKATVAPRYKLWVTPKQPLNFLNYNFLYYDSWRYTVLLHEYTHVLQMSPGGNWRPFRWLFGSFFHPAAFLPRWYIEGIGTDIESWFSQAGRLNSPIFYANVRAMVTEGTWGSEDISRLNERLIPTYPFQNRRYFYGSLLMNEISTYRGLDKFNLLNLSHARSGKLFINKVPRKILKADYPTLLQTAYNRWKLYAKKEIDYIQQKPLKDSHKLPLFNTSHNITSRHSPHISPDGKNLLFIQQSIEKGHHIVLLQRPHLDQSFLQSKGKIVAFGIRIKSVHWINNEEFVFDRIHEVRRNNITRTYNDVYKGHISGRRPRRLTFGQRLQFPALSWNQKHLLAIQTDSDKNTLVQINMDTKEITPLYPADRALLSYPFALTEDEIVFLSKEPYQASQIKVWNQKTKQVTLLPGQITSDQPFDPQHKHIVFLSPVRGDPSNNNSQKRGLLYTSTASGIANLYFWDAQTQTSYPVTHTLTAIQDGAFDPYAQELWVSQMHADGHRLEVQKSHLESIGDLPQIRIPHSSEKKLDPADGRMQEAPFCHPSDVYLAWQISEPIENFEESARQKAQTHQDGTKQQVDYLRQKWQKHFQDSPPPIKKYQGMSYLFPYFWFPWISYSRSSGLESLVTLRGSDPLEHHQYRVGLEYTFFRNNQRYEGERFRGISNITFNYDHYRQWHFSVNYTRQNIDLKTNNTNTTTPLRDPTISDSVVTRAMEHKTDFTLYRRYFFNTYWDIDLGWRLTIATYAHPEVDTQYVHGPYLALYYHATHPDTSFLSSKSENFYIEYTKPFYFSKVINSKPPSLNEVETGFLLVWSFPSPLRWMLKKKQPLKQNSSLRYHEFSLRTDHTFTQHPLGYFVATSIPLRRRNPQHLIRGYPEETFGGRQLHSLNLEYAFPFLNIYRGMGTMPLFFRNTDMVFVLDSLILKGDYRKNPDDKGTKTHFDRLFTSIGMELKWNITLGYDLPISLRTGIYYGLNKDIAKKLNFGLSFETRL